MFSTDHNTSGYRTRAVSLADLAGQLTELDRFGPTEALAVRMILAECLGWIASGAHNPAEANPTAASLARDIAGDIAKDGPVGCVPVQCADCGTDRCVSCAYSPARSRLDRFRQSCRQAIDAYRSRCR